MGKTNPTAHRKRIKVRVRLYIATRVTVLLRTLRSVLEFLIQPANPWVSPSRITTETTEWIFVANDTEPNRLYKNNGNGTFTDEAVAAGVAFSEAGTARAGMGVDAGDYDGSARQGIVIGNFTNESMALYSNDGAGLFTDDAPQSGIGKMSAQSLTFAVFFFDYDLDGLLDVFAANGHVSDDISVVQPNVKYAQPPHLFRNKGKKKFEEKSSQLGRALHAPSWAGGPLTATPIMMAILIY